MNLVKNLQALHPNNAIITCDGCEQIVASVHPDCHLCDVCIQDADDRLMEDVGQRGWEAVFDLYSEDMLSNVKE